MLNYKKNCKHVQLTLFMSHLWLLQSPLFSSKDTPAHTHLTDRFAQHDRQTCIHALLNYFTFFVVDLVAVCRSRIKSTKKKGLVSYLFASLATYLSMFSL